MRIALVAAGMLALASPAFAANPVEGTCSRRSNGGPPPSSAAR